MIKKCILLAAGYGTRLQPITNDIPKCLIEINGKPLLEYWLILLYKHGITHVLINTHYLSEKVIKFIKSNVIPVKVTLSYEKDLLGSLGTIIINKEFYKNEESILVVNADNLTNLNLSKYFQFHLSHNLDSSIALINSSNPSNCGIVEMDTDGNIISFEEKPKNPKSNISNAGVYLFNTSILNDLKIKKSFSDIGYDLLPNLIGLSRGYLIKELLIDIGSHSSLRKARSISKVFFQSNFDFDG